MESLVLKLVLILQLLLNWLGLGLSQSPQELWLDLDGCASISTMQLDSALPLPALCHTLQFANDRGCFCFPSSSSPEQTHKDLTVAATDICGLNLWLPESPFCRSLAVKDFKDLLAEKLYSLINWKFSSMQWSKAETENWRNALKSSTPNFNRFQRDFVIEHSREMFPKTHAERLEFLLAQSQLEIGFAVKSLRLRLWIRYPKGKEVMPKIFESQVMFPKLISLEEKIISVVSVTSSQNVAAAGGLLLVSCLLIWPCFRPKKRLDKHQTLADKMSPFETDNTLECQGISRVYSMPSQHSCGRAVVFSIAQIAKATRNFSPSLRIGQGGFGTVYKGFLEDGTEVAIKRAKKNVLESRLTDEFRNEVAMLAKIEHQNLLKLIGYCDQEDEHILVTEYVTNGNLREHLDGERGTYLDFATRLEVAINVVHALTYLHMYADLPIIHRDVKSANVLLTDNFKAKIADFGFSRIGPVDVNESHVSTGVKGTAGYLDPEYLNTNQLTPKSDVYSFGILLVELLTGRRPLELTNNYEERSTITWAFRKATEGKLAELLDPRMAIVPGSASLAEKIFKLAFDCSAPARSDRPSMKEAQQQLWEIRSLYYQTLRSTENIT